VAALALAAVLLLLAGPRLRRRRLRARSPARVLFPFRGTTLSRSTLDATLRLAQTDLATLVPAYIATVPMNLSLEAPIAKECATAMPLLEAIERRAARLEVPVDSRIERGRSPRHALTQLLERERFDRIVVPAQTSRSDGFEPDDIAWLLEHAPTEVVVLRPGLAGKGRPTEHASVA
jgi:nucleotide-binding universal stress UspA family protein